MLIPERALSLAQPWASLVARDAKRVETRSWRTRYRGLIAIHASRRFRAADRARCSFEPFASSLGGADLPLGAIVAVARIVDVLPVEQLVVLDERERAFGNYATGRYGWLLADVVPLPVPIPCRGALGLWRLPADVRAAIGAPLSRLSTQPGE